MPGECPACCSSGPFSPRACMEPFRLLECTQCNSVFLFPQPSETELALFYNETYYGKARKKFISAAEAGVAALTRLKWNRLRPLLGDTGPLLDIGCGRGTLLKLARAAGVEAYGIERPSPLGHSVPNVVARTFGSAPSRTVTFNWWSSGMCSNTSTTPRRRCGKFTEF